MKMFAEPFCRSGRVQACCPASPHSVLRGVALFGLAILALVTVNRSGAAPTNDGLAVAATQSRPNILFILADDFGRELLPSYGGQTDYHTPRLQQLAAAGMQFQNCYATPLCAPSRIELMTGRYSFRNYTRWGELDARQLTFAQCLRTAGYATGLFGKWQMGGWQENPPAIVQAGFTEYCSFDSKQELADSQKHSGNCYWGGTILRPGETTRLNRYGPDVFTDDAVAFMRRHRGGPFLAYCCLPLIHRPFQPTPDQIGTDAAGAVPPEAILGARGAATNFTAMVRYTDRIVGRLLDALNELGLTTNTVVIFTGDNGTDNVAEAAPVRSEFLGQQVRGGKYFPTELGVNVPLLVCWPGHVSAGRVTSELVDFTDFLPTLCELAGAVLPENYPLDGRSFLPVLQGREQIAKPGLFTWGNFEGNSTKYKQPARHTDRLLDVMRDDRWKLYSDDRLFDLQKDFLERAPVAVGASAEADAARKRLRHQMQELRRSSPRAW